MAKEILPPLDSPGTLLEGEAHPASADAAIWVRSLPIETLMHYKLVFASTEERVGEVCYETLRRILEGEPVSDRYLFGLAWVIRTMEEK